MSFNPEAIRALGGRRPVPREPTTASFLIRIGVAAGVAAAACNVAIWLLAAARGWNLTVDGQRVQVLSVVLVCLVVGIIAGLGSYVAARVTKRPALWVGLIGLGFLIASLQGLPPTLAVMHVVTGAWVVGWLVAAVRGGSHLR